MSYRQDVANLANSQVGYLDGAGYNGAQKYSPVVDGARAQAWCADFFSWLYITLGIPLPSMQPGIRSGFAGVPEGRSYALAHQAWYSSWDAQPGDGIVFTWPGEPGADHIEVCMSYNAATGTLYTVGGNSVGPQDQPGGVWAHSWACPVGVGHPEIMGAINVGRLVTFNSGGNLMAFGPSGTHIDLTIVGTDSRPYHLSSDLATLGAATWSEIGGPSAFVTDILAQGYTADGSHYVVVAKGIGGKMWFSVDEGAWAEITAGVAGAVS